MPTRREVCETLHWDNIPSDFHKRENGSAAVGRPSGSRSLAPSIDSQSVGAGKCNLGLVKPSSTLDLMPKDPEAKAYSPNLHNIYANSQISSSIGRKPFPTDLCDSREKGTGT